MSVFHSDLFRQQALIAGSWRDAADGTTLAVSNPSTGATLGQIPNMGRAEAQQAVDAAAAALPGWRAFTAAQRAASRASRWRKRKAKSPMPPRLSSGLPNKGNAPTAR